MVSRQCANCEVAVGEGTEKKLQLCSKCKITSYCCKDCQVKHWPKHSQDCARNVRMNRELAKHAKDLDAATKKMQAEYRMLPRELPDETIVVARTALRLGKADSLAQTHLIRLRFSYDPSGRTYRERMHFEGGEVIEYADALDAVEPGEQDNILRARSQTAMGSSIPGAQKPASALSFVAVVRVTFSFDLELETYQLAFPLAIHKTSLDYFSMLKESKLNPDWQAFFRRVWEVPRSLGQYPLVRADYLASEDPEEGREFVKQYEKARLSKLKVIGVQPLDL